MRALLVLASVALALLVTAPASAQRRGRGPSVSVNVVDMAGGRAFLEPGGEAGIRRDDVVVIGRRRFRVIAVTRSSAVIEVDEGVVAVGNRGRVRISEAAAEETHRLPPVSPVESFEGQWPQAQRPALGQHPEHVDLGFVETRRDTRLVLSSGGGAILPLGSQEGDALGYGFLRARVHAEPLEGVPLSLDGDAALQLWVAGEHRGGGSRPLVRVRQLELAYGEQGGLFGALGRLRYAASTIGQLDGIRVRSPALEGFTVGAFGGVVPDPLSGMPSLDASRFGLELAFEPQSAGWRPMIDLVAHGSLFDGALDERRVTAAVQLFPGRARMGAHAEVSLFDQDNPWNAPSADLTGAGVDARVRTGRFQVGARLDLRKPERSRWLASFLPASFLCTAVPQPATIPPTPEPCAQDYDARLLGALDAGVDIGNLALSAGGTAIRTGGRPGFEQIAGFVQARAVRLLGLLRADASVMVSSGSLLRMLSGQLGLGASLLDGVLDLSVHYHPAIARYEADIGFFAQHGLGTAIIVAPMADLEIDLTADAMLGRDLDALLLLGGVTWRPEL